LILPFGGLVLAAGEYVTVISWGAVPEDAGIIYGPEEQFSQLMHSCSLLVILLLGEVFLYLQITCSCGALSTELFF
jgi:hypothetical protein